MTSKLRVLLKLKNMHTIGIKVCVLLVINMLYLLFMTSGSEILISVISLFSSEHKVADTITNIIHWRSSLDLAFKNAFRLDLK